MALLSTLLKIVILYFIFYFIMRALFGNFIDRKKKEYIRKKKQEGNRFKSSEKIDDADFEDIK
jgi:hypothetical protein